MDLLYWKQMIHKLQGNYESSGLKWVFGRFAMYHTQVKTLDILKGVTYILQILTLSIICPFFPHKLLVVLAEIINWLAISRQADILLAAQPSQTLRQVVP